MPGHAFWQSAVSCAKMAEPIDILFGLWTGVGRRKHTFNHICQVGGHIGATWWIRLNCPSVMVMRPYVKLLWPLVWSWDGLKTTTLVTGHLKKGMWPRLLWWSHMSWADMSESWKAKCTRSGTFSCQFKLVLRYPQSAESLMLVVNGVKTLCSCVNICLQCFAFSALTLLVGWQEGHPVRKNWAVRYWRGCLSEARSPDLHMV